MGKSFILYTEQMMALSSVLSAEQLGRLMRIVLAYQATGKEPETVDSDLLVAWALLKVQMQMDEAKYHEVCEKRKMAARKGGEAKATKWQQMQANGSKCNQEEAKAAYNDNKNDNKNDNDNDTLTNESIKKPTRKKKFKKPTLTELQAYCNERRNNVDPERFIAHYEANGWKVGKAAVPMVDWKAAVRTWEGNGFGRQTDITAINNGRYGDNDY